MCVCIYAQTIYHGLLYLNTSVCILYRDFPLHNHSTVTNFNTFNMEATL